MYQNLWYSPKAVQKGKFIACNEYIRKEKKSQINLTSHLKNLEKREPNKPKASRRKYIIKNRNQ